MKCFQQFSGFRSEKKIARKIHEKISKMNKNLFELNKETADNDEKLLIKQHHSLKDVYFKQHAKILEITKKER
jgi:hypothetical protein